MREAASGLSAILDVEMNLHVKLCASRGLSAGDLEQAPPAAETLAYTRYVLDAGMRGDLLALQVALAPCVIGYAEIAIRLAERTGACAATNPYSVWINEYAGAPYQEVAAKARSHIWTASPFVTPHPRARPDGHDLQGSWLVSLDSGNHIGFGMRRGGRNILCRS